jgi:Protein of unknown function DUF262
MDKPYSRATSILDFVKWQEAGDLQLTPKFQRRNLWPPKARSFLIDTILRGFPIPKLYMRQHLNLARTTTTHEVVDGQQRIRAVLDYYNNEFKLSRSHGPFAGSYYKDLEDTEKRTFLSYEFTVDILVGAVDADVLNVFGRINSYSAPLNAQEKRNATYFGTFKQFCYDLAYQHLEFWKDHNIWTDRAVSRMREVELTSELVIGMLEGLQDKKKTIDRFYKSWDDTFPKEDLARNQFRAVVDSIEDLLGPTLQDTIFHRPALFYSLFLAFHTLRYGSDEHPANRKLLTKSNAFNIINVLHDLSEATKADIPPRSLIRFIAATERQTDNIGPRRMRHRVLIRKLSGA